MIVKVPIHTGHLEVEKVELVWTEDGSWMAQGHKNKCRCPNSGTGSRCSHGSVAAHCSGSTAHIRTAAGQQMIHKRQNSAVVAVGGCGWTQSYRIDHYEGTLRVTGESKTLSQEHIDLKPGTHAVWENTLYWFASDPGILEEKPNRLNILKIKRRKCWWFRAQNIKQKQNTPQGGKPEPNRNENYLKPKTSQERI